MTDAIGLDLSTANTVVALADGAASGGNDSGVGPRAVE